MIKYAFIVTSLLLIFSCNLSKNKPIYSRSISDCLGAVPVLQNGLTSFDFIDGPGEINEFIEYAVLQKLEENNSVWFSYIAPYDGKLFLSAKIETGDLKMVMFDTDGRDICADINSGRAEIKRLLIDENVNSIKLSDDGTENALYPLEMIKGQKVHFVLFSNARKTPHVEMNIDLVPNQGVMVAGVQVGSNKTVDMRRDSITPHVWIEVKDVETGEPVIADINIFGIKEIEGFYNASDIMFQSEKAGKIKIEVSAGSYFFIDRLEPVASETKDRIIFWLEPLRKGKTLLVEDIEFKSGTSIFLSSAEPKLKRLKQFMFINADIKIEIQGHVLEIGPGSATGQSLSEARAKQVMNYLIDSGIDKDRLKAIGFGGTKPIFAEPKFAFEEQANRRVEIVIQ